MRKDIQPQQPFGSNENRFREPGNCSPAPGEYNELNKWNKRTFNLKFLNGQSQAQIVHNQSTAGGEKGNIFNEQSSIGI